MKKLFFCSIIFLTMVFLNSCAEKIETTSIKSYQFDIYSWEWQEYGTSGQPDYSYIAAHDIPDITSDIVNNGTVLGYIGNTDGWFALPYTLTNTSWSTNINYAYVVGGVGLTYKDSDLLTVPPSGTLTFKMVILTPKQMPLIDGINPNNYEAVADALELEE